MSVDLSLVSLEAMEEEIHNRSESMIVIRTSADNKVTKTARYRFKGGATELCGFLNIIESEILPKVVE